MDSKFFKDDVSAYLKLANTVLKTSEVYSRMFGIVPEVFKTYKDKDLELLKEHLELSKKSLEVSIKCLEIREICLKLYQKFSGNAETS